MWACREQRACRALRAACRVAAGQAPHSLVEQLLELGLWQGVVIGYCIRKPVVPGRWPAYRGD
jgi:hypothetical protein